MAACHTRIFDVCAPVFSINSMFMRKHPQRIAWITLIASLVVFCAFCFASVQFIQYVLFEWPVDLNSRVYVSKGTITVLSSNENAARPVRDQFLINEGDRISTDESAQGHLTFRDPLNLDTVVATVQLLADSQVEVRTATRPRFFGDSVYSIRLSEASGSIEVVISMDLERDVRMEIDSGGQKIRLDQAGSYLINADQDAVRVIVQRGEALLVDRNNNTRLVKPEQEGLVSDSTLLVTPVTLVNLVENDDFSDPGAEETISQPWGCSRRADTVLDANGTQIPQPNGIVERVIFEGRPAVHISRLSNTELNHAENWCLQPLNGLDVRGYSSLVIRVKMYLVYHSVSGCGQQASECVLMVRLKYRNARNLEQASQSQYIHGFYIHYDPRGTGYPIQCADCATQHDHVNAETWFTFETENLISNVSDLADLRPLILDEIQFDSSGHEYEVYVSEVSIIAESASSPSSSVIGRNPPN